jgi:sugar lactone lactonase YvrE
MTRLLTTIFVLIAIQVMLVSAYAAGPQVWSVNSRADVMRGDARGVSIAEDGTITLAPAMAEAFKTGQQYVWSSAVDAAGNVYLGTGGDGKIFRVAANGTGAEFADLAELNVSALVIGRGGELFAGTSPDGKVYRIAADGKAEVYFDPKEKYIWSLAALPDGLAVATGDGGRIYKVRSAGAMRDASLLFDTSETHVISLTVDRSGNLYAGTDPNGLVMRFGPDGKPFGMLDSPLREIHELAIGPDGSLYVLALGESVSTPKPDAVKEPTVIKPVTVERPGLPGNEPPSKSRYDLKDARSALYRALPDGSVDLLWASSTVTAFSIYAHQTGRGVLLGTSDKGRIYDITNEGRETLVLQSDAGQISTIKTDGRSLIATASNPGSFYRVGPATTAEGSYESPVLDAKATATWGRIWWRSSGDVMIQTRSGNTEKTDETWSPWSAGLVDQKGAQVTSPKARYIQWRAVLKPSRPAVEAATADQTSLSEVNLAFAARNLAPEVLSINVLPTNVGLIANPPVQIDPNIELSGMEPATFGIPVTAVPPRRAYQRGATSLQWTAEDRNGDRLVYDVYYREIGSVQYTLLRGDLTDNFLAIDGQSLADGRYVFRVVARDTPSNPIAISLSGDRFTEPVDIDNTPPTVTHAGPPQIAGDKARVVFDALEMSSYLTRAEYSVNGGDWRAVYADDGISDSPRERYSVEILLPSQGEYAVTLRVYDINANSGNARVVVRR